jgi:hypothetical protein
MATMTMRQRKQKLADAELDCELDRIMAWRSTLKRRFKYGPSTDRDLDQVRAMRARLSRFNGSAPVRRHYSSAEVLRGHGGPELQGLVRDLLRAGRISYNSETACEFHKLTGRELR